MAKTERQSSSREKPVESIELDENITSIFNEKQEMFDLFARSHMVLLISIFARTQTPLRFNELQDITEVPRTTLSARLSELVEEDLITRHAYNEIPPRVEYEATQSVRELRPTLEDLFGWWSTHKG